jgi:hypothetical protein
MSEPAQDEILDLDGVEHDQSRSIFEVDVTKYADDDEALMKKFKEEVGKFKAKVSLI